MTPRKRLAQPPEPPSIDEQIKQLKAAGWIPLTRTCWKAPVGSGCAGCFLGPHGAWKAMERKRLARV